MYTDSSTCMTFVNSRFLVVHWRVFPRASTSLSSMTQDSARVMIPFGAQRGREPRFRMRRVVRRLPAGETVREMTSHERMWDAYGLGYRRKYASETMGHESLHHRFNTSGTHRATENDLLVREGLGVKLHCNMEVEE